ncbi:YhcN/YlaJ family sporulation lipoprotein [Oceanobacillus salinisoli]|uniref:YhcN/YlaJ family sporulation lipoprotein n=1 Tax=Oceanobacillus salinisoli TaxID=2678611 RepID=UPI0012E170B5|nr:YhcN/YlaJ family sporulation lipoprotein [Oceanobacillus salinisoli]
MYNVKSTFIFAVLSIVMIGCTNADNHTQNNSTNNQTQPIHYDTRQEHNQRIGIENQSIGEQGGYPQTQQPGVNAGDNENGYTDPFTNEETEMISSELKKERDIVQAQVASTDDRIIVAVMLREHFNQDVAPVVRDIEGRVRQIVPNTDKEIVVYTDDIQWDRLKNLHARTKASENGENIEELFENLINQND